MIKKLCFNFLFLLGLACSFYLQASVDQYLKKDKSTKTCKSIRNIDFIYIINLNHRTEKLKFSLDQLKPYDIVPYRFSAVNGWLLSIEAINHLGVKLKPDMQKDFWGTCYLPENKGLEQHEIIEKIGRNYFCHCMSKGAIGIILSHLSVLQDALDFGYETIWVMEDDIEVLKNPHILSSLIDKLDLLTHKNWDVLFTDQDTRDKTGEYIICNQTALRPNFIPRHKGIFLLRKNVSYDFRKIGARYGTYSMIIRRSGMKKILNFIKTYKIFLPYDMDFYMAPNITMYTPQEDIVASLLDSLSDNGTRLDHLFIP